MIEHDLLGNINVPDDAYFGAQTQRSIELFKMPEKKTEDFPELIRAVAMIKYAYADAHMKLGVLPEDYARCIKAAAKEVFTGRHKGSFPTDILAGGGCVGPHMDINEVIAKRACELLGDDKGSGQIHPNTHVNMGQSTNDVIPAAMKLALYPDLIRMRRSIKRLRNAYAHKAEEYRDVVKVSRTCIQDAVPITFGQFFGASVSFLDRQLKLLEELIPECLSLPLGATAVGTGLNSYPGASALVMKSLSKLMAAPVTREADLFDGLQYTDFYLRTSAVIKGAVTGMSKMARDLRLMSSGPRSGFGEISIAPVQNGSSIMPGKVNPAVPELMNVLCYMVVGNDAAVTMAVEAGELELNVWEPVIIMTLLDECQYLPIAIDTFAAKCVETIRVNEEVCRQEAEKSLALAAMVSAMKGYQKGTEVAQYASEKDITLKEAVVELQIMDQAEAEIMLDPLMMTDSDKSGEYLLKFAREKKE